MLSVNDALAQLLAAAILIDETETVPISQANGRIAAATYTATTNVPAFDNSAMDGYALARQWDTTASIPVVQRIAAGQIGTALQPGTAARIFTGAPVPAGTATIVMQEDCHVENGTLQLKLGVTPYLGQYIRRAGEDISNGATLLTTGDRVDVARIALLAAGGIGHVRVFKPLRITLLSTGDELVKPGEPLPAGGVYDSNRPMLCAMLQALGCDVVDGGHVPDDRAATEAALSAAAAHSDVIISTGGVSVGEEDHVKAALSALGSLALWKVAIKPGKPLAFGRIGNTNFIGLPGNPVSAFVTMTILVRPFLLKRMGTTHTAPNVWILPARFDWPKPDQRQEYLRAMFDETGVALATQQGSAMISGLANANGLVEIAPGQIVHSGDLIRFLPFEH